MDFLGNKAALLPELTRAITSRTPPGGRVIDLFSGTGVVSSHLADRGYTIHANDLLPLANAWATAQIGVTTEPQFAGIRSQVPTNREETPYRSLIAHIATLPPVEGWITKSFTPHSRRHSEHSRQYFSVDNGMMIDAVRNQLREWKPSLTAPEYSLLQCALVAAADEVSNTAGTYGAYMKSWKPRALRPMRIRPISFSVRDKEHAITDADAQTIGATVDADVAYSDPPYTKRQYAAYYHVLNAIVGSAEPAVSGVTGLSNWREWESEWCYARKAPDALRKLVSNLRSRTLVLSYSSDGHIPHEQILQILGEAGKTTFSQTERRRYKSSGLVHTRSHVYERVYVMSR